MYGYIYKTTNLITGKIYVGQKKSDKFLAEKYLGSGKRLREAINKYGEENFKVELIEEINSSELMDIREIYWISYYNATNGDIGYNLSEGGNVNRTMVGENNPFYGKHHNEEAKAKMKEAHKHRIYRKHTEEEKLKIGLRHKGKIVSEKTKQKLSENAKNNPNYGMKGKHFTEEAKKKISIAKLGKHTKASGTIYVTNDINEIRVSADELQKYLDNGWHRGRKKFTDEACKNISKGHKGQKAHNKGKIWVTDGIHNKFIFEDEFLEYEKQGYHKGMKPKNR